MEKYFEFVLVWVCRLFLLCLFFCPNWPLLTVRLPLFFPSQFHPSRVFVANFLIILQSHPQHFKVVYYQKVSTL